MAVVWTIEEKCRRCYSCVHECPAKAIKVENGQAKVIESRCLGCGHCVNVCSQNAKAVKTGTENVLSFLKEHKTITMLAPSFPAVYPDMSTEQLVGAIKACGFDKVVEVAFGADLVNKAYMQLLDEPETVDADAEKPVIATSCPALFQYVQKYMPELVSHLAPVVSPMVAMGRAVRYIYGDDQLYQVFLNIAINAAEAMPDGGTLTIKAFVDYDTNRLRVLFEDTGVGIPKENQSKVFTPFFTTKQIGKGTGLGLAIVYGILKMHKGNVKVQSEVNKGSTFTFYLPLEEES